MRELGILEADAQVEWVEGQVLDKMDLSETAWAKRRPRESNAMFAAPDSWMPFHRFTVDEFHRMAEAGVLAPDARVELIEGEILDVVSRGSWHCGTVDWLSETLYGCLREKTQIRVHGAVSLSRLSQPEPDMMLLKRRADFYRCGHPKVPHTLLVIEVSDSSLRTDQVVKIPLFAHFGVPEVWVVDGVHERLHQYRTPRDGKYTEVSSTEKPGVVALAAMPDVTVDLSDLFG